MPLHVVVEILASGLSPRLDAELLGACSAAMTGASCVSTLVGDQLKESPAAIAVVTWTSEARVIVEIGSGRGERAGWTSQELAFGQNDPVVERWRAAGFAVAALAENAGLVPTAPADEKLVQPSMAAPANASPTDATPVQAAPSEVPARARVPVWMTAAGVAGPALDSGAWRWGGLARLELGLGTLPVAPTLSASYQYRPRDEEGVDGAWLTLGGGLGTFLTIPATVIEVRARAEAVVQHLKFGVVQEQGSDEASRWGFAWRFGLSVSAPTSSWLAATAGVDLTRPAQRSVVELDGEQVGTTPTWEYQLGFGARLRWNP